MPATPDLPLVELLHAASREVSTLFETELEKVGIDDLTARQAAAILVLEKHSSVTQRELADLTGMDRSSLSEMLRRMETRTLIERKSDPKDARSWHLELSSGAKDLLPNIKKAERATMGIISKATGGNKKTDELRVALRGLVKGSGE